MSELPHPHPIADLHTVMWPRPNPLTRALLDTAGLELSFNARGALLTAFTELSASARVVGRATVLVPAFHCPSAITPAIMAGLDPVFYRIRPDLSIDWDDVAAKTEATTTAILVIHFFGVAPDLAPLAALRARGVRVVEDCSHAFVSLNPLRLAGDAQSEYRIFSFWKLAPSGVGGGLLRATGSAGPACRRPPAPLTARVRCRKLLLEDAIQRSDSRSLRAVFNVAEQARLALRPRHTPTAATPPNLERGEDHYPVHAALARAAMPSHVRHIIEASDMAAIAEHRRTNFARFQAHLNQLEPMRPLIPELPENACPWVYPVLLPQRERWDHRLRSAGLALHTFGIYLHSRLFLSTDAATVSDAKLLAQQTLCLAIHQGITPKQIDLGCASAHRILKSH